MMRFRRAISYEKVKVNNYLFIEYNHYLKELETHLPLIESFFFKIDFSSFENPEEMRNVLFNVFIYYLINGNNNPNSKITPWVYWKIFCSQSSGQDEVILDYSEENLDFYLNFLQKYSPKAKIGLIKRKKRIFLEKISLGGIFSFLLFRNFFSLHRNNKIKNNIYLTNYDRYYENNSFFNPNMLNSEEYLGLLKKLKLKNSKKNILFLKYGPENLLKYLTKLVTDKENLFLEDVLKFKYLIKYFLKLISPFSNLKIRSNKIIFTDPDEEFLHNSFIEFMKRDSNLIQAFYFSSKDFIKKSNLEYFAADSEKNFLFSLFELAKRNQNKDMKSITFTHEVINKYYLFLPLSKKYDYFPDYKLVWSNNVKKFLLDNYNISKKKLIVFEDPRWFFWKKYKLQKKSILIISQGLEGFYNDLFNYLKLNKNELDLLISKGFIIYFKAHPAEFHINDTSNFNKICTTYSKYFTIIEKLDFIPEYSISDSSTLSLELIGAGSKGYFTCKENYFLLDDDFFNKIKDMSIENFFKKIK